MIAAPAVKPLALGHRYCRRCHGTGFYSQLVRRTHLGVPGLCLLCDGKGQIRIPTPEEVAEKKARDAAWRRLLAVLPTIKAAIKALPTHAGRHDAQDGLSYLYEDRERLAKMVASVEAGRVDAVVAHLITYCHERQGR